MRTRIFGTVCAKTTTKSLPKLAEASKSSKERFQWKTAGDKIANLIQCLATNQSQMECNSSDFNGDKVKQYEGPFAGSWLSSIRIIPHILGHQKLENGICLGNRSQNINFIASVTTNSFIFINSQDAQDDMIKRRQIQ